MKNVITMAATNSLKSGLFILSRTYNCSEVKRIIFGCSSSFSWSSWLSRSLFTFRILLFFPPYGLGWNIRVLGGFFHHGLLDYLAGLLWCHGNSPIKRSSFPKALIPRDALPIPWRTQMWVQVKDNGRGRNRGTLPSSQHFEG